MRFKGRLHQEVGNSLEVAVSLWLAKKLVSFHTN